MNEAGRKPKLSTGAILVISCLVFLLALSGIILAAGPPAVETLNPAEATQPPPPTDPPIGPHREYAPFIADTASTATSIPSPTVTTSPDATPTTYLTATPPTPPTDPPVQGTPASTPTATTTISPDATPTTHMTATPPPTAEP